MTSGMKRMNARYAGKCRQCGTAIRVGESILWARGEGVLHVGCDPGFVYEETGETGSAYAQGRAEAQRYSDEVKIYGRELADQFEAQDELARYNRGEDY